MTVYDYKVKDAEGNEVELNEYKGKVLLIVNTATGCGFTPQYEGLQKLYDKYKEEGFEILDFPCNQFGQQAPGTEAEIVEFCQLNYNVSFKTFHKIDVNGDDADPLFKYMKTEKKGALGEKIKWNFTKFLVDKDGNVVERFGSAVKPEKIDSKVKAQLEKE